MNRRGGNGINIGIMLLMYELLSVGFEHIPPVTLVAILVQVAIFLGFVPQLDPYTATYTYCVRADRIWYNYEWWRLLAPVLMHASDMHLYYNMASLLWKGRKLERRMGSTYFLYILCVFSLLCSLTMVGLSVLIEDKMHVHTFHLMQQCAVGFSGVLFAMKVLVNHYFAHEQGRLMAFIPVQSKWLCWAELILIQILIPQASFVGHLAGILVGSAYVFGPLKYIMHIFMTPAGEINYWRRRRNSEYCEQAPRAGPRFWGGGQSTGYSEAHNNQRDYDEYTGGLNEDEQFRRAMHDSAQQQQGARRRQPTAPQYPTTSPTNLYPNLNADYPP